MKLEISMPRWITLILLLALYAPSLKAQAGLLDELTFELITGGLHRPVAVTHAGDGSGRLFITLQRGQIVIHDGERILETPFLDIRSHVGCCGERGLLSVAFHPNFEANGWFFVNYTNSAGDTVVSRFRVSANPNFADPGSERILFTVDQPFANHNGGQLQFGPDGFLYIGMGDGGSGGDPGNRAQDLSTVLGKLLRIDVDQGNLFSIPPSNPFATAPGARGQIWALGLRNPWRFSFDRRTGDLFMGDVGQNSVEEINFQPASSSGGENYGWRIMEGSRCFNPATNCANPSLTLPILEYSHVAANCGGSVTAGYRYRGFEFPQLDGVYFYADYCTTRLFAGVETNGQWSSLGSRQTGFFITSFGEDEAGELYFTAHSRGELYRITTNRPLPSIFSLSPSSVAARGPAFLLTVIGSNFVPASEVQWNGSPRPTTFIDNTRLQASISSADITAQGVVQISVLSPPPGGGLAEAADFSIVAEPGASPMISAGGVVEAGGYALGSGVAPGSIAAVFGDNLASITESAMAAPLPATLGGATLRFNGSVPVPKFFVSLSQMNVQIPWELDGLPEATLTNTVGGQVSPGVTVSLAEFSPGVFSMDGSGGGQGAVLIAGADGTIAAPRGMFQDSRPVRHGETIVIFATGLGPVSNPPATGAPTPESPFSETLADPTVTIGGVDSPISFSGLSPGSVGLYQVSAEVQEAVGIGDGIPVTLTIGGITSNTVTIAVE